MPITAEEIMQAWANQVVRAQVAEQKVKELEAEIVKLKAVRNSDKKE